MAALYSTSTTCALTDAATWNTATATATGIHATAAISLTTAADVILLTFTAPNTTDASTGCVFFLMNKGSSTSLDLTLQEDLLGTATWVDTAATVSINSSDLPAAISGHADYMRALFPSYTFATTGANRYRIKARAVGGTITIAANAAGSAAYCVALDSRSAAPGSGDTVWWTGINGTNTTVNAKLDGTVTTGLGTDTTTVSSTTGRLLGFGMYFCAGAIVSADETANHTLILKGSAMNCNYGDVRRGTSGTPHSTSYLSRISFDPTTSGDFGWIECLGAKNSYFDTTRLRTAYYVSGTGTAASPLVINTAGTNWAVGDELVIGASSDNATNYNECEKRYIITVNSSTSFVISSTSGGSETALVNTHNTNALVVNLQSNVLFDTQNTAKSFWYTNNSTTYGNVVGNSGRFETTGSSSGTTKNVLLTNGAGTKIQIDNMVFYRGGRFDPQFAATGETTAYTYTNCVVAYNASTIGYVSNNTGAPSVLQNKAILDGWVVIATQGPSFVTSSTSVQFNNCHAVATGIATASSAGLSINGAACSISNFSSHANRGHGIYLTSAAGFAINTAHFGDKGKNQGQDILAAAGYQKGSMMNCYFGSTTRFSTYTSMLTGSEVTLGDVNGVLYANYTYTREGIRQFTGSGLADTTTRTVDNFSLRLAPESISNGIFKTFNFPVEKNKIAEFPLFVWENAAFVANASAVVTVDLYLPVNDVLTLVRSKTMTKTTDKDSDNANATLNYLYTSTRDGTGKVVVTAYGTIGDYVFVGDPFNGGNSVTGFRSTLDGDIEPLMVSQVVNESTLADTTRQAVWNDTATYPSGTKGNLISFLTAIYFKVRNIRL